MSYRMLLLGKTGNGKSATGNSILRRNVFRSEIGCDSVTKENKTSKTIDPQGKEIIVADTIGLLDTKVPMNKNALAVQQSLSLLLPGPHAFLIIMQPGRFTEEEKDTVDILRIMFGPKLFHHAILVFTRGDNIPNPEVFFQRMLSNESMSKLMNECHGGYIIINNNEQDKAKMEVNLAKLMEKVQKISNFGKTYYQEDISIFQNPIKKYAEQWTSARWNREQIKTLIHEQGEERERIHRERIKVYEEDKAKREREIEESKREFAVKVKEAELEGYRRGVDSQPNSNVKKEIAFTLLRGVMDIAANGAAHLLSRSGSSRGTGSELLQNLGQRREHPSAGSHNSLTSNTFDAGRYIQVAGNKLYFTGEKKTEFTCLGTLPHSDTR